MASITPYTRAPYPTIEGNDRVYFDNEFRKLQETTRSLLQALKAPFWHNSESAYVIVSGVATITETAPSFFSMVYIDTEAAGATDDLNTITWAAGIDGQLLQVWAADSARTVVLKDSAGNMKLAGDCTLDDGADNIILQCFGGNFWEICRSNNA